MIETNRFFLQKEGVNQIVLRYTIGTQSIILAEPCYHTQVWEHRPRVSGDLPVTSTPLPSHVCTSICSYCNGLVCVCYCDIRRHPKRASHKCPFSCSIIMISCTNCWAWVYSISYMAIWTVSSSTDWTSNCRASLLQSTALAFSCLFANLFFVLGTINSLLTSHLKNKSDKGANLRHFLCGSSEWHCAGYQPIYILCCTSHIVPTSPYFKLGLTSLL